MNRQPPTDKTMGEAKRRGTFEERRQQSIERRVAAEIEAARKERERREALTPEQREAEDRRRHRAMLFAPVIVSMASSMSPGMALRRTNRNRKTR